MDGLSEDMVRKKLSESTKEWITYLSDTPVEPLRLCFFLVPKLRLGTLYGAKLCFAH